VNELTAKKAHVKRATQTREHECHWPDCKTQVKPALWGCLKHWKMLPKELRDLIWATYRPGQERNLNPSPAYVAAAHKTQEWIRQNHPPEKPCTVN